MIDLMKNVSAIGNYAFRDERCRFDLSLCEWMRRERADRLAVFFGAAFHWPDIFEHILSERARLVLVSQLQSENPTHSFHFFFHRFFFLRTKNTRFVFLCAPLTPIPHHYSSILHRQLIKWKLEQSQNNIPYIFTALRSAHRVFVSSLCPFYLSRIGNREIRWNWYLFVRSRETQNTINKNIMYCLLPGGKSTPAAISFKNIFIIA